MPFYINIDTNPDPDCCFIKEDVGGFLMYILYPPSNDPWSLTWCDQDDIDGEALLIKLFGGVRLMEGVIEVNGKLPENVEAICKDNDIAINKIGERLEDC